MVSEWSLSFLLDTGATYSVLRALGTHLSFSFPYYQGRGTALPTSKTPALNQLHFQWVPPIHFWLCQLFLCPDWEGIFQPNRRFYFFSSLHLLDLRLTCGPSPPSRPPTDYNMSFPLPAFQWAPSTGYPQILLLLDTISPSSSIT